jgi:hypothetical protein
MFEVVEWIWELISCILGIQIIDLDEISEAVLNRPKALRTHYLPSGRLKMRIG